jgi:cephalosporin-C deacetylase
MPMIDMPLDELKLYQGSSPCPADFDAYWERALEEMRGTKPNLEFIPAGFTSPVAECFDMYFTGVGGARIHAKYLRPGKQTARAPAALKFHGYSLNAGDWFDLLPYAASGFHVAALDCRGQGGYSEDVGGVVGNTLQGHIIRGLDDEPDKLLFRSVFLDTAQLAGIIMAMPEVDESRVGAFGGSQGGGLTLACAALEPRINRLAPLYPFLSDYRRVWKMDLAKTAYLELAQHFRRFDPMHQRENEIFTRLGYIDVQNLAARIRGKVQMTTGLMDETCPPSTQFAAYNKIVSPKEVFVYPDYEHEVFPGYDDRTYRFMMEMATQ